MFFTFFGVFNFNKSKWEKNAANLKRTGLRILIKSEDISIRSRKTFIDVEKEGPMASAMLDSLHGSHESTRKDEVVISILICTVNIKGKDVRFVSKSIYLEEEIIKQKLMGLGSVLIYVNPNNYYEYIFDLDILFE